MAFTSPISGSSISASSVHYTPGPIPPMCFLLDANKAIRVDAIAVFRAIEEDDFDPLTGRLRGRSPLATDGREFKSRVYLTTGTYEDVTLPYGELVDQLKRIADQITQAGK